MLQMTPQAQRSEGDHLLSRSRVAIKNLFRARAWAGLASVDQISGIRVPLNTGVPRMNFRIADHKLSSRAIACFRLAELFIRSPTPGAPRHMATE